jgi:hypothetical protein
MYYHQFNCPNCKAPVSRTDEGLLKAGDFIFERVEPLQGHKNGDYLECKECFYDFSIEWTFPSYWSVISE